MARTIGCIGIGKMGRPMSQNLLKNGFRVIVYDVSTANMQNAIEAGAAGAASVADVAERADTILLSLPNISILEQVVCGEGGLTSCAAIRGTTVIDTTTATMASARMLQARLAQFGAHFLDAPVTGGVPGAVSGRLRFFVGGDETVFAAQQDVFSALGSAVRIGVTGHGQAGKMLCQMIGSAHILMAIEAAGFGLHLGVDLDKINEVLTISGRGPMDQVLRSLKTGQYNDQGYLGQRSKDIDYCLEEASRSHTFLPITAALQQVFHIARMNGLAKEDNEAIIKLYQGWIGR